MERQMSAAPISLCLAALFSAAAPAHAQPVDPCSPAVLGSLPTDTFIRGLAVDSLNGVTTLYLLEDTTLARNADAPGQEDLGLRIADASDPFNPVTLGSLATFGTATDIAVVRNGGATTLYIADGGPGGLLIVDAADPANPLALGSLATPGDALGVDHQAGLVAIADGHAGVHLIDVADPANPVLVSTFDTDGLATDVLFNGGVLYVADRLNGVLTLDISSPLLPVLVSQLGTQGSAYQLAVADDITLLVAGYEGGVVTADIATPDSPAFLDEFGTPGTARSIAWDHATGDVVLADLYAGVHRIDGAQTMFAGIGSTRPTAGAAVGIAAENGLAYVADNQGGLRIFNMQHCADPCPADFAPSYGVLDLADVVEFAQNFQGTSNYNEAGRAAALAEPTDVTDLADIVAFVESFSDGCP